MIKFVIIYCYGQFHTQCSFGSFTYRVFIKYSVFSKNSRNFATSPSPAQGCYWLYTRIALRVVKVSYSDVGEGGDAVNCEITQYFLNTLYIWFIPWIYIHTYIYREPRVTRVTCIFLYLCF